MFFSPKTQKLYCQRIRLYRGADTGTDTFILGPDTPKKSAAVGNLTYLRQFILNASNVKVHPRMI